MHPQINTEEWRDVVGYEGFYIVSNRGNVQRTRFYKNRDRLYVNMIPDMSGKGYPRLTLSKPGLKRKVSVHRLVVEAFIGPVPNDMEINHINGIPADSRVENLEIVTKSYNQWHATHVLGKRHDVRGSVHGQSKLTEADIPVIRRLREEGIRNEAIARQFGVSITTVSQIFNRRVWSHV